MHHYTLKGVPGNKFWKLFPRTLKFHIEIKGAYQLPGNVHVSFLEMSMSAFWKCGRFVMKTIPQGLYVH